MRYLERVGARRTLIFMAALAALLVLSVLTVHKDLALDRFTSRPGVTRIETSIIFDGRRRHELPVFRPLR